MPSASRMSRSICLNVLTCHPLLCIVLWFNDNDSCLVEAPLLIPAPVPQTSIETSVAPLATAGTQDYLTHSSSVFSTRISGRGSFWCGSHFAHGQFGS
jgi:hypothetical protein